MFECLRDAGFKMRSRNANFMRTETKYLGGLVSTEVIKPNLEAVTKSKVACLQQTKRSFKSFLRLANYYRDFMPFHTANVRPMQELLRKNQQFCWNEKHQEAFESLKQALADITVLEAPNEE